MITWIESSHGDLIQWEGWCGNFLLYWIELDGKQWHLFRTGFKIPFDRRRHIDTAKDACADDLTKWFQALTDINGEQPVVES
jgi:hypothetical protein